MNLPHCRNRLRGIPHGSERPSALVQGLSGLEWIEDTDTP
jgi:hypothetical protein